MLMRPEVSICLPTYNGSEYLQECLTSIVGQSFGNFEILIVDDCSSDDTLEIARMHQELDPRVKVIVNERNLGLVGNWNKCCALAEGEWIKFVFQDDILDPCCIEKLVGACSPNDFIAVCERRYLYDGVSSEIEAEYREYEKLNLHAIFGGKPRLDADEISLAVIRHLGLNFIGEPTSVLLNKKVFKQFGDFNPSFAHLCDLEFWIRVAGNTGLVYLPERLVTFRVHSNSTSAANRDRRYYRSEVLDQLILLHEFAFHHSFDSVRKASEKVNPPLNLQKLVGEKAFWAYSTARAAAAKTPPETEMLLEWQHTLEKYPLIIRTPQFRWLLLRDFFKRHLLWRVTSPS